MFAATERSSSRLGALAVLRHQVDAAVDGVARRADHDRLAVEAQRAAERRVDAEDRAGQLGPPGADQAGEAEDLAAPHVQADGVSG